MLDFELNWSKIFPNGRIPESFATSSPFPRVPVYSSQLENARGYDKSGGWRFGKPTSTQTFQSLYTPEAYNSGLLDKVGNQNKKGPVTEAVSAAPVTTATTTGLLDTNMTGNHGGGYGGDGGLNPGGTDYGAVIGDPSASGKGWGQLTSAQQAAYESAVDPHGVGKALAWGVNNLTPIGWAAKALTPKLNELTGYQSPDEKSPNATMSEADQRGQYAAGRAVAEAMDRFGTQRDADSIARDAVSIAGGMGTPVDGDTSGMSSVYAKGGMVKGLLGPNPPGKDDGYAALDRGEYVVKASAVKKLGKKTLDNINKGKLKKG